MLVFVVFNHMRVLLFQLTKGGEVESLWGQATPGLGFDPSGSRVQVGHADLSAWFPEL